MVLHVPIRLIPRAVLVSQGNVANRTGLLSTSSSTLLAMRNATEQHPHQQQRTFAANLTFIGPPGSGKGTYSSLLLQASPHQHQHSLSAGDVLREHVAKGTDIGQQVAHYQRTGRLVRDDNLVAKAILQSLEERRPPNKDGGDGGFILDGFPRTIAQAQLMQSSSWPEHLRVHYAVSIEVPQSVCTLKIMGRRKCLACGESFNVTKVDQGGFFMPATSCSCGTRTMSSSNSGNAATNDDGTTSNNNSKVRQDDTLEIAKERYEQFAAETAPVIEYYEERNQLIRFVPYNGVNDLHILQSLIEQKIISSKISSHLI